MSRFVRSGVFLLGLSVAAWGAIAGPNHAHPTSKSQKQGKSAKHDHDHDHEHGHAHHPHHAPLHGGIHHEMKEHQFETVLGKDGLRVFLYTASGAPAMVKKIQGTAVLTFPDGSTSKVDLVRTEPKESDPAIHFCPMHDEVVQSKTGVCAQCGSMRLFVQDFLFAGAELSKALDGPVKATVTIQGLKGKEGELTFTAVHPQPKSDSRPAGS